MVDDEEAPDEDEAMSFEAVVLSSSGSAVTTEANWIRLGWQYW